MNIFYGDTESLQSYEKSITDLASNLTVVGKIENQYRLVVECQVCKQDPELFHTGLFDINISHLKRGKLPCGCSPIPKWNKNQQITRMMRELSKTDFSIVDMSEYSGYSTKIVLNCKLHGNWQTNLLSIVQGRCGCLLCSNQGKYYFVKKSDATMSEEFLQTGAFAAGTQFERSNRKTTQGSLNYWIVYCPVCSSYGEAITSDLKKGCNPCSCSKDFRQAYINIVLDGDIPIALKFGVTKNIKERLYRQNLKSVYNVSNLFLWEYPDRSTCLSVETEAKSLITSKFLPKSEFKDGWTETCQISYLDDLIRVFSKKGQLLYYPKGYLEE